MKNIWDICPAPDASSALFPGKTAYEQQAHVSLSPGCPANVSRITL